MSGPRFSILLGSISQDGGPSRHNDWQFSTVDSGDGATGRMGSNRWREYSHCASPGRYRVETYRWVVWGAYDLTLHEKHSAHTHPDAPSDRKLTNMVREKGKKGGEDSNAPPSLQL